MLSATSGVPEHGRPRLKERGQEIAIAGPEAQ